MEDALNQLVQSELVFRRGVPPQAFYTFKHALVRDIAYESLLKARRAELHAKVLAVLETQGIRSFELMAQHAEAAGNDERALDFWEKASAQAMAAPALKEALAHNDCALRV